MCNNLQVSRSLLKQQKENQMKILLSTFFLLAASCTSQQEEEDIAKVVNERTVKVPPINAGECLCPQTKTVNDKCYYFIIDKVVEVDMKNETYAYYVYTSTPDAPPMAPSLASPATNNNKRDMYASAFRELSDKNKITCPTGVQH